MSGRQDRYPLVVGVLWLLNRVSAGLVAVVATAVLFDLLVLASLQFGGGQRGYASAENPAAYLGILTPTALLYGTIPATAVLCLTRARARPWRALPRLIGAASLSALGSLWLWAVGTSIPQFVPALATWWTLSPAVVVVSIATLGTVAATFTLPREQHSKPLIPDV